MTMTTTMICMQKHCHRITADRVVPAAASSSFLHMTYSDYVVREFDRRVEGNISVQAQCNFVGWLTGWLAVFRQTFAKCMPVRPYCSSVYYSAHAWSSNDFSRSIFIVSLPRPSFWRLESRWWSSSVGEVVIDRVFERCISLEERTNCSGT